MILKKLRSTRGTFILDSAFNIIMIVLVVALCISVLAVIGRVSALNAVADEAARYIEIHGEVDANTDIEVQRIIDASRLPDCTYTIEAVYMPGTQKVQFGDMIAVRIEHTSYFGVGGIIRLPVTLSSRSEGKSEQYWK